jgi:hypothetical protein
MLAPLSLLPRTVRDLGKNRQKHEKSHGNFHYQGKGSATLSMAYAGARLGKARFPSFSNHGAAALFSKVR